MDIGFVNEVSYTDVDRLFFSGSSRKSMDKIMGMADREWLQIEGEGLSGG